jgi:hypothetical protein
VHTLLWQSVLPVQVLLVAHFATQPPPQSLSDSEPFLTPSKHVGVWHTPPPAGHTSLVQSVPTAQATPLSHREQAVVPPQSTALSPPFFTPSVQEAGWHTLLLQTALWQSPPFTQLLPGTQAPQVPPPQSTSVSVPFCTPSRHVGFLQVFVGAPVQTLLTQSPATLQILPPAQAGHVPPPQSLSVSAPFWTLSVHVAAWHAPPTQTPLAQSVGPPQPPPVLHLLQVPPPQSVPVSAPFLTLSVQVGAWQRPPVQTPLVQSVGPAQPRPVPHLPQDPPPPQSTPVSTPFLTPSAQVGAWQTLAVQTPLAQSPLPLQAMPGAHFRAQGTPQSVALSVPFLTPSKQEAA